MIVEAGRESGGCQTILRVSLMTLGCKCGSLPRLQFCQIQCQSVESSASVANKRENIVRHVCPTAAQMKGSYKLIA